MMAKRGQSEDMARSFAAKQYEFTGRLLEQKSSVEHQHHSEHLAEYVARLAQDGWELVQIYVVPEPKHALMGTAVDYGVYGLFRREKKEDSNR
jgi:hypothetical protein